jgi:hypothetical protein
MQQQDDGQQYCAHILEALDNHKSQLSKDLKRIHFLCSVNDDQYEEVLSYADIIHHIQQDESTDILWKFKSILAHEGPLTKSHPNIMDRDTMSL